MPTNNNIKESRKHNVNYRWYTRVMDYYRSTSLYLPGVNTMIRTSLAFKMASDKKRVLDLWEKDKVGFEEWKVNTEFIFGFSSYRSGTVFLTNILKTFWDEAHFEHEANVDDYWNYPKVIQNPAIALEYIKDFRAKEMWERSTSKGKNIYGEINPFLRIHSPAIKEVFPNAKLFHVIRDGRDVVRSIMSREILSKKDPLLKKIVPPIDDPYRSQWGKMSRFERVCWQWQFDNAITRKAVSHLVKFELFRKDYNYFKENISDYIGFELSQKRWEELLKQPKNITPKYAIAHWTEWTNDQKESFERICGDEMSQYGYELNW